MSNAAMKKHYITITVKSGPMIRGCDDYTVPWADLNSVLDEYLDGMDVDERRSLGFELRLLTDREFEVICHEP